LVAAGTLLATPFAAFSQAQKRARVGYIHPGFKGPTDDGAAYLSSKLGELGWVEGRNLILERRYGEGRDQRVSEIASEFVQLKVEVIVLWTTLVAHAVHHATRSIPIVALNVNDPVAAGFAQTLTRPGGNVTGVLWADPAFSAKTVQLLKETLPGLQRIGAIFEDTLGQAPYRGAMQAAAREMGLSLYLFAVKNEDDVRAALVSAKEHGVQALRISYDGVLIAAEAQLLEFAAKNKLVDFYTHPTPVARGGFMSYTPNIFDTISRAAALTDNILRGGDPGKLPFEYPTRTRLEINMKAAKERGIVVPNAILLRADRVIE